MSSLISKIFRPEPRITREHALEVAGEVCKQQGWSFEEPILVTEQRRTVTVHPGSNVRPGGPWIRIDVHTGDVVSAQQPPR